MTPERRSPTLLVATLTGALLLLASSLPAQVSCTGLTVIGEAPGEPGGLFADDFESGDTSRWGAPARARAGTTFSTRRTVDLQMVLELGADTTGEHLVEYRLRLPGGHLYQSIIIPVDASSTRAKALPARLRVPGYPHPLEVQSVRTGDAPGRTLERAESPAVVANVPVAGTLIASGSLHGVWSSEAFIDGAETPCATASFTLVP